MKTFEDYMRYREAMVADDERNHPTDETDEVIQMLSDLMKEAWLDDPTIVLSALNKLEEARPGKFSQRISEIRKRRNSPFGRGLDKPEDFNDKPHHDVIKPLADRPGDPGGDSAGGGGGEG